MPLPEPEGRELLDIEEVTAQLRISESTIRQLVKTGKLRAYRIGGVRGQLRFKHTDLDAYIESTLVQPDETPLAEYPLTSEQRREGMITMGDDEFILYIRKQYPQSRIRNDMVGRHVWPWLRDRGGRKAGAAEQQEFGVPCFWGDGAPNGLPKTATQFTFDRALLPELYTFLDDIAER